MPKLDIRSPGDLEAVLEADIAFISFGAPSCPACRESTPGVEHFAEGHPELLLATVRTDEVAGIAKAFGIRAIPTLVVTNKGQHTATLSGIVSAEELDAVLEFAKRQR